MGGWESCTATYNDGGTCASGLGDAEFSMRQGVSHPSLTGSAAQFWLGGGTPYSNALWWKHLSPDNGAKNFVYDLYLYITDPYAPQSLEFDVNHSIGDRKFIFGTECDFKGTHTWRVWDTANVRWIGTDVPCEPFQGHSWNHLTFRFQRTDDNKAAFVSVTINGRTLDFNRRFDPLWITASEINVAFQMDGNSSQQPYSVWLDKVSLTYW